MTTDDQLLRDAIIAFWDREDWRQGYYSPTEELIAQARRIARLVQWADGKRDNDPCPICEADPTEVHFVDKTGGTMGVRCPFHKAVGA